jgi:diphosphomevalonate decarboxylase
MKDAMRTVEWISPSNIALVKYWGKKGDQLPANPSLSLTLKDSCSHTTVTVSGKGSKSPEFLFEGKPAPEFEPKIETFLKKAEKILPYLKNAGIRIDSRNTFPHSAGIASSASSMSALALCLCDLAPGNGYREDEPETFLRNASSLARMGSGSASRSVYGGFSLWGKTRHLKDSSDDYAVPLDFSVHPAFTDLKDSILIVSPERKKLSSSAGHALMENHPYAGQRREDAEKNIEEMLSALRTGDTHEFIRITEKEALGLHALMLSSDPAFTLLKPGTLEIIERIRDFRQKNNVFLCFTLDAGPNVHLLYPPSVEDSVTDLINSSLLQFCDNGTVIHDECGKGPQKVR